MIDKARVLICLSCGFVYLVVKLTSVDIYIFIRIAMRKIM